MIVYLDIIFIENIFMNFIILFTTSVILKIKVRKLKLLISSVIGAIYAIVIYMDFLPIYSNFFMKIFLSIIMISISFFPRKVKSLFKQLLIFYLTSFVFGGCAFFLIYIVKPQEILINNGVYVGIYPIKMVLVAGIIGFFVLGIAFKIVKAKMSRRDIFCEIEIFFNYKKVKVKAILDTGNLLREPITGIPVIVVEKQSLYEVIPNEILDKLEVILGGEIKVEYMSKFRVIPFTSLGKQNGLLLGFKVDKVKVIIDENEENMEDVIIGIYDGKLTKNGAYTALIGLDILEGRTQNEYIGNVKN